MYGSTMIGKLADGVTAEQVRSEIEAWEKRGTPPGYMSSHVLVGDDGSTVINVAVFDSKESYFALADSSEQDEWWQQHYAPLLAGEPQWVDGTWIS